MQGLSVYIWFHDLCDSLDIAKLQASNDKLKSDISFEKKKFKRKVKELEKCKVGHELETKALMDEIEKVGLHSCFESKLTFISHLNCS